MWTGSQRARHKVSMPRERRGYPTDISDKEWKLVEPLLPNVASGACCPTISLRIKRCTTGSVASCDAFFSERYMTWR
jgi:hypothetical protein